MIRFRPSQHIHSLASFMRIDGLPSMTLQPALKMPGPKNAQSGRMLFPFLFSCRSCERPAHRRSFPLCIDCSTLLISAPPLCQRCGGHLCVLKPNECFGSSESAIIDSYTARYLLIEPGYSVLKSWKKHGGPIFDRLVLKSNAEFLSRIQNSNLNLASTVVVPVPQSYERSWKLGRSPAFILAEWISRETGLDLETDLLTLKASSSKELRQAQLGLDRRLQTPAQCSATERAIQLAMSRQLNTVVLVDDFMTTGHTLRNTALALKEAGFSTVHAVVLGYRPRQFAGDDGSASLPAPSEGPSLSGDASGSTAESVISSPAALKAAST
jgi:predicted amidophosphoribosyltransferase